MMCLVRSATEETWGVERRSERPTKWAVGVIPSRFGARAQTARQAPAFVKQGTLREQAMSLHGDKPQCKPGLLVFTQPA